MNLILMIIISALSCIIYDFIKTKLVNIKLEKLKEDDMFSMFEDYFKED